MKSLITAHPVAIGLMCGTALVAMLSPAEAGGRSGRAAGFSQHEMNGLSGTMTGRVLSWYVVQTAHFDHTGSNTRTGTGTTTYGGGSYSRWIEHEVNGRIIRIRVEGPKMKKGPVGRTGNQDRESRNLRPGDTFQNDRGGVTHVVSGKVG